MKKIYYSFLCVALSMILSQTASAQRDLIEILRSDAQTDVKILVTEGLSLTEDQSTKFWPIYDQFTTELKVINNKLLDLIKDYATNYETMTEEKANELATKLLAIKAERLKLQKSYYGKIKKGVDAKTSTRFLQIMNRILAAVDLSLAGQIPLVF
jgi:hypothetical protein